MKKMIWALTLAILLTMAGTSYFASVSADEAVSYDAEQIYKRAGEAVLYIRVLNEDNRVTSTGTGVIVSPEGLVATAYHVADEDADRIEAVFSDGRTADLTWVDGSELTDAALLKLPVPSAKAGSSKKKNGAYPYLPIRTAAVNHGEKVYAIGYPLKNTPIITEGIINSPRAEINGRDRILTSAQIASGMSGGPIVDRYGQLAGIISGSLRTMNNIHLAASMDDLRSLLPDADSAKR